MPKSTDEITLSEEQFNQPIEVKQVDEISETPYALPPQYSWDNLDLNDDEVA